MTCIVAVKTEKEVWMGGDSAISDEASNLVQTLTDPKVWKKGKFLFGFAGSLRLGQLMKYKLKIPPINNRRLEEYMVTSFVDAMRKCFTRSGASKEEQRREEQENEFLIGIGGRLFGIDGVYGVCEVYDDFVAIGSGSEYALGSLYESKGKSPEERIKAALEAASYFCSDVGPPFCIVKTK